MIPITSLCNIATRQTRAFPNPPLAPSHGLSEPPPPLPPVLKHLFDYCGVGLDSVADDIKVVLIRNYGTCEDDTLVFISGFRLHIAEQRLEGVRSKLPAVTGAILSPWFYHHINLNGFIYWLFFDDYGDENTTDDYVMAFDTGSDVFHKINCPVVIRPSLSAHLGIYRDDAIALIEQWRWIKHLGFCSSAVYLLALQALFILRYSSILSVCPYYGS
ncbi:unnamed protein product [Linum trigynum]|uniref:Uncharacterized protein n=1 Tax=Linum trigynum TaxID=586398 RepID=A0AAV2DHX6_9ROSI